MSSSLPGSRLPLSFVRLTTTDPLAARLIEKPPCRQCAVRALHPSDGHGVRVRFNQHGLRRATERDCSKVLSRLGYRLPVSVSSNRFSRTRTPRKTWGFFYCCSPCPRYLPTSRRSAGCRAASRHPRTGADAGPFPSKALGRIASGFALGSFDGWRPGPTSTSGCVPQAGRAGARALACSSPAPPQHSSLSEPRRACIPTGRLAPAPVHSGLSAAGALLHESRDGPSRRIFPVEGAAELRDSPLTALCLSGWCSRPAPARAGREGGRQASRA